jgi:hypothetical protein
VADVSTIRNRRRMEAQSHQRDVDAVCMGEVYFKGNLAIKYFGGVLRLARDPDLLPFEGCVKPFEAGQAEVGT